MTECSATDPALVIGRAFAERRCALFLILTHLALHVLGSWCYPVPFAESCLGFVFFFNLLDDKVGHTEVTGFISN